jgi:apolipoprotein D and lipocalin family protein
MVRFALLALALVALPATGCGSNHPPLDVAEGVELTRFQGAWFEVAHLSRSTQLDCVGTKAYYKLIDASNLEVIHECHLKATDGAASVSKVSAKVPEAAMPAKWTMNFGGHEGDYWILEVGTNYEYAVVGHPSRRYLWILSRTPKLDPTVLRGILERTREKQFQVDKLEYTPQP